MLRRLQKLYHHGFLDRPLVQLAELRFRSGSQSLVYGLGRKGAKLLREEGYLSRGRLEWRMSPSGTRPLFLAHTLGVADFMVALEVECRELEGVELLDQQGMPMNHRTPPSMIAHWRVDLGDGQRVGVVPDAVFRLRCGSGEVVYFLEYDRGTMPVLRSDSSSSSFGRKLRAYVATWEQGLQQLEFGVARFRVLTVTSSRKRLGSIAAAVRGLPRGRGLFLLRDTTPPGEGEGIIGASWDSAAGGDQQVLVEF